MNMGGCSFDNKMRMNCDAIGFVSVTTSDFKLQHKFRSNWEVPPVFLLLSGLALLSSFELEATSNNNGPTILQVSVQ